jgi:hypothetical protein
MLQSRKAPRPRGRLLAFCAAWCAGAVALTSGPATAEEPTPALSLFKEGRALAAEGKYAEACPKFEASLALEVGVGTQFNLADCWEHVGRTASAQKLFLGAAASAKAAGQAEREQVLRDRAAALEPRIAKLVIDVSDASPRLTVKLDQLPLAEEQWGKAVPVDAGHYEVTAKAPGKKAWSKAIDVKPGASVVSVEVPTLESTDEAKPVAAKLAPRPESTATRPTRAAQPSRDQPTPGPSYRAITLAGFGVVALAAGTVMGLRYKSNNDAAKSICPSNQNCSQKDIENHDRLVDSARSERAWMYVGAGAGVACLAGAAALYLWERPGHTTSGVRAVPVVAAGLTGASIVGRF